MKKIFVVASFLMLGISGLWAAGTAAGTSVDNQVTLNYTVGTVAQTAVVSNTDTFVVDKKLDFTLVHNDTPRHLVVVPGATDQVRAFTLTNTGNALQDFALLATNLAGATLDSNVDNEDVLNIEYSLDGTTWSATPPAITNLAADTTQTIYVRSDIPAAPTGEDGDVMNIQLEATAVRAGTTTPEVATAGADTQGAVDTVLAEGTGIATEGNTQFDGKYSAWAGYEIATATIDVAKSSCVVSDPVNGTTNPKRIPGATLRYAIEVQNTGTANAVNVSVADILDGALTYQSGLIATESPCNCASPGASNGDSVSAAGQNVTANFGTVGASTTECAYINVLIN